MKLFDIDSEKAISDFLAFIFWKAQVQFDPEYDVHFLKNSKGENVFDKKEADYYEEKMNECFLYCVFNKLNMYKIAINIFQQAKFKIAA